MTERISDHLARLSRLAMLAVIVFLLASMIHYQQEAADSARARDAAIDRLNDTNDKIVAKLTDVFEAAQSAEDAAKAAGTVPATTVAAIVESLRGYVDPALIQKAIDAAKAEVATTTTTRPRTPTTVGHSTSTTTIRPSVSTSTTTAPAPATTTSSTSTTTTTNCLLVILTLKIGC